MYCKKCNVKLKDYLKKCPLCNTPVNNNNDESNPYNQYVEDFSTRVNVQYFSRLIMKIVVFLSLVTFIINLSVNGKVSWSLYVIASSVYICSYYFYLILENKKIAFISNMLSLELLLFIISYLTHSTSWFLLLVGPIILMVSLFILLNVYLSHHQNILRNFSTLLVYIALCLFSLDVLINIYKTSIFRIHWSIYSNIPILIIAIILFGLSFNKKITNEVEKRFFI